MAQGTRSRMVSLTSQPSPSPLPLPQRPKQTKHPPPHQSIEEEAAASTYPPPTRPNPPKDAQHPHTDPLTPSPEEYNLSTPTTTPTDKNTTSEVPPDTVQQSTSTCPHPRQTSSVEEALSLRKQFFKHSHTILSIEHHLHGINIHLRNQTTPKGLKVNIPCTAFKHRETDNPNIGTR